MYSDYANLLTAKISHFVIVWICIETRAILGGDIKEVNITSVNIHELNAVHPFTCMLGLYIKIAKI